MIVAKQFADLITATRGLIAFFLIWLGSSHGAEGLSLAVWLMLADWIGDAIDGPISRRSSVKYHTWIGDHDLEVDMTVSIGLLIYLLQSGYLSIWVMIGLTRAQGSRPLRSIIWARLTPGRYSITKYSRRSGV